MAIIREHLATKGLGLLNDLQNESSIVGNFPTVLMMRDFGTDEQKAEWMPGFLDGSRRLAFGLTEPDHGSDATFLETTAVADGDEWVINGRSGSTRASTTPPTTSSSPAPPATRARRSASPLPRALTDAPGFSVDFFWWTFNMPTDHAEVTMTDVRVPSDALFGRLDNGLELAQTFVHENRIRQAASSLGRGPVLHRRSRGLRERPHDVEQAAVDEPGHPVPPRRAAHRGGDAAPAHPQTAVADGPPPPHGGHPPRRHVQLPGQPAGLRRRRPRMQTCGGIGYTRHMPFEHIYRHHRRYRITEGSEEIQMRKVAQHLFVPAVSHGWTLTDATTICDARTDGAVATPPASSATGLPGSTASPSCCTRRPLACDRRAGRSTPD